MNKVYRKINESDSLALSITIGGIILMIVIAFL